MTQTVPAEGVQKGEERGQGGERKMGFRCCFRSSARPAAGMSGNRPMCEESGRPTEANARLNRLGFTSCVLGNHQVFVDLLF